jgi:hypothetical protein
MSAKPQSRGRSQERKIAGAERDSKRSCSQALPTVRIYQKGIQYIQENGPLKFLQRLHDACKSLGEPLFKCNQTGGIVVPIELAKPHTWGQFSGLLAYGCEIDDGVFAGLMLTRDMFSHKPTLTKTGAQHCSDNDSTWTKNKALALRGDLAPNSSKGKGKGKGKGTTQPNLTGAAATASDFGSILDGGIAGDKA